MRLIDPLNRKPHRRPKLSLACRNRLGQPKRQPNPQHSPNPNKRISNLLFLLRIRQPARRNVPKGPEQTISVERSDARFFLSPLCGGVAQGVDVAEGKGDASTDVGDHFVDYFEDFDVVCEGAEEEGSDAAEFEHESL